MLKAQQKNSSKCEPTFSSSYWRTVLYKTQTM